MQRPSLLKLIYLSSPQYFLLPLHSCLVKLLCRPPNSSKKVSSLITDRRANYINNNSWVVLGRKQIHVFPPVLEKQASSFRNLFRQAGFVLSETFLHGIDNLMVMESRANTDGTCSVWGLGPSTETASKIRREHRLKPFQHLSKKSTPKHLLQVVQDVLFCMKIP